MTFEEWAISTGNVYSCFDFTWFWEKESNGTRFHLISKELQATPTDHEYDSASVEDLSSHILVMHRSLRL